MGNEAPGHTAGGMSRLVRVLVPGCGGRWVSWCRYFNPALFIPVGGCSWGPGSQEHLCTEETVLRYSIMGSFLPGPAQSRGRKESPLLLQVPGVCKVATEAVRGATTCCSLGFPPAELVDKVAAVREFRVLHTALHSSPAYRDAVSGALHCLLRPLAASGGWWWGLVVPRCCSALISGLQNAGQQGVAGSDHRSHSRPQQRPRGAG